MSQIDLYPGAYLAWRQRAQRYGVDPVVLDIVQKRWQELQQDREYALDIARSGYYLNVTGTNVCLWFNAQPTPEGDEVACIMVQPPAESGLVRLVDVPGSQL